MLDKLKAFVVWASGVVGNAAKVRVIIIAFIILLILVMCRSVKAAELDFLAGSSFLGGGNGPVIGLDGHFPVGQFDVFAGTRLWGATRYVPNNWSWEAGYHACRWSICAAFGATYLQRVDVINGSHANFFLELQYLLPWKRVKTITIDHISNAGTEYPNIGRNAALVEFQIQ